MWELWRGDSGVEGEGSNGRQGWEGVGKELPCPFCHKTAKPKKRRTYRCHAVRELNWLQEEMHLPNYLERDPRVSRREAALTVNPIKRSVEQSGEGANEPSTQN